MKLTTLQQKTLKIITEHGSENPITGLQISRMIDLPARKSGMKGADMRSIISALRVKGIPICANGKGYFWPKNQGETEDYIGSLQARIDQQQEALEGISSGINKSGKRPVNRKHVAFMVKEKDLFGVDQMVPRYESGVAFE